VLRRLLKHVGAEAGTIYGKTGKQSLIQRVRGYANAARFFPWVVLVDLDDDDLCAPPFVSTLLASIPAKMCLRVAVREIEAWLLADRERVAAFLGVRVAAIPEEPETVNRPKRVVVDIARRSRRGAIRDDMVPRLKSGRIVGPAYTSRLIEFVSDETRGWRPEAALTRSLSLARAIACIERITRSTSP
jgi:hypothetical protein